MAKALPGFVVGGIVGVMLGAALLLAAIRLSSLTFPFDQDSVGKGVHSHMMNFVHDVTTFHGGEFDADVYWIWFEFETSIATSDEYFMRVEEAIQDTQWKLLDSYHGFRLYVGPWEKRAPYESRAEIALRFNPKTQTVTYEETSRPE